MLPRSGNESNNDSSGRNLAWTVKHLQRAPCEKFQPVIVNPWIPVDVPSNRTHLPWILGDRHQAIEISDDAEDPVDPDEQETIVEDQDVDVEEDFSLPDGEGTQLDRSPQDIDKDNDSTLTTQQSLNKQGATVLLSTAAAEIAMDTTSPSTHDDDDIAMQDASEQNDSAAISSENEKPSQPTSLASEDESDHDESGRTLWCVCNGEDTGTSMTQCHNHNDPACKGKWYHHTCVDLTRPPPKHMDWYCDDCRKKLKLGVYSNGCVDKTRTVDKKRRR
jgi:hypothetical protein